MLGLLIYRVMPCTHSGGPVSTLAHFAFVVNRMRRNHDPEVTTAEVASFSSIWHGVRIVASMKWKAATLNITTTLDPSTLTSTHRTGMCWNVTDKSLLIAEPSALTSVNVSVKTTVTSYNSAASRSCLWLWNYCCIAIIRWFCCTHCYRWKHMFCCHMW